MLYYDLELWRELLDVGRGEKPCDLLIRNVRLVDVLSGAIREGSVAVHSGRIVGFGEYNAVEVYDGQGGYLAPGLIEGHIHIESSKLTPRRFAEVVVPRGTTTVIADPHEIANVWGLEGIRYMIRDSRNLPLDIYFMAPSCVPATHLETAGAYLHAEDLRTILEDPNVLGIGEVMNFVGALKGDPDLLKKVALSEGSRPVDGHSPGLRGRNLYAYLLAGPQTDHECNILPEAREKLEAGMRVMIREGSTARNLSALAPLVTPLTERRCLLVSDDRRPGELVKDGHLDWILRRAVEEGIDPILAMRMVTLNVAETFGLNDRGALKIGWWADMVLFDDLKTFKVRRVWKRGNLVAEEGKALFNTAPTAVPMENSLAVPFVESDAFEVPDRGTAVRVIEVIPNSIWTGQQAVRLEARGGRLMTSGEQDVAKLVVVERHQGSGRMGIGFVKGLGISRGAIGSSVAHDSHNIVLAGMDDISLKTALEAILEEKGGLVAVERDRVLATMPLPVAGLMSDQEVERVVKEEEDLLEAAQYLGSSLPDPFMALSFLALPVIPELKLTDRGLVDATRLLPVNLYLEEEEKGERLTGPLIG